MNRIPLLIWVLLTVATVGVLPAAAVAQGPDGYMPAGPGVVQDTEPPAQQAVQAGALPFTGLDLGLMALAGLAVLALGAGLRRVATRPSTLR